MKRWIIGGTAAFVVVAAAAITLFVVRSQPSGSSPDLVSFDRGYDARLSAVGLTVDQRLVSFRVDDPDRGRNIGRISGLQGDTGLLGIDYRVQDGQLYGVGDAGGVYTISTRNAVATKVSQLTVALSGTSFGVDFNPAADRLRIVSDTGQNLRHNVNTGGTTLSDTMLTTPPATVATTGVTAVAYTNNDLDVNTGTALYDIDTVADQVALQAPANNGTLSVIGKLGVDTGAVAGFDIYSLLRNGTAVDAAGFATLTVGGRSTLYSVSLITGRADKLGQFPRGWQVTDLALPLDQR